MAVTSRVGSDHEPPLRVLHVARRFAPFVGGQERYIQDLAAGQVGRGRDVVVLTLDRDVGGVEPGRLAHAETVDGVRVRRMAGLGTKRTALGLRPDHLVRAMRWADVAHVHDLRFLFGTALLSAMATRTPVLFHTHGLIFATPRAARLKRLAMRDYYGRLLRASRARILASSKDDADVLLRLVPSLRDRTVVVENAIALDDLLAVEPRPEAGRILVMGRVVEEKGLRDLVPVLARLRDVAWHLVVAGTEDAAERNAVEQQLREAGLESRVAFRGGYTREHLPDLLAHASVAVFPSRAEGFGLALLEAMAAGTPVLARDLPAHRALLGEGAEERLFDPADVPATAGLIERSLSVSQEERLEAALVMRDRARGYRVDRLLDDIERIYDALGVRG